MCEITMTIAAKQEKVLRFMMHLTSKASFFVVALKIHTLHTDIVIIDVAVTDFGTAFLKKLEITLPRQIYENFLKLKCTFFSNFIEFSLPGTMTM